ncbi:MAG: thiamine phosphate synthase, partial [Acidobacteriota bacterium]
MTYPLLCLVTDRRAAGRPLLDIIRDAAHGGVDLIQIRERDLDGRALTALVRAAVDAAAGTGARIVVNDRLDVALAAGAAGVHLRADSFTAAEVRQLSPPGFIVGRSIHGEDEAAAIEAAGGCDYLTFGTVFPSARTRGHSWLSSFRVLSTCVNGCGVPPPFALTRLSPLRPSMTPGPNTMSPLADQSRPPLSATTARGTGAPPSSGTLTIFRRPAT